jgi:DNA modification methylase
MPTSTFRASRKFEDIPVNEEWCFKNVRSTEQWTHGYHRYPAKFLPNLVEKLISKYTSSTDVVADLFAGCGTTLVEAKIHGRKSIGVDINPVAELITNVKTKALEPSKLELRFNSLLKRIAAFENTEHKEHICHEKIDYWFSQENKHKIAHLYGAICRLRDEQFRNFFLVALSHVLKNCSKWLQSSTKPQIDKTKKQVDPFDAFKRHAKKMIKINSKFFDELSKSKSIETACEIRLEDARSTTITNDSVGAIITSPPYVTSYEYADIHQLTSFWFEYITDLPEFRRKFIGTFYSLNQTTETSSILGQRIVNKLLKKDERTAKEVANYFTDMGAVTKEMYRILKPGGHTCLVIGNTTFLDVKIQSAEVFTDLLKMNGFKVVDVIKRSIPHKLIPTIRDKVSGRFVKPESEQSKLVYPEEYIIIAKKYNERNRKRKSRVSTLC